jgi:uncharacterized cupin superfamily protein
MPEDSKFTIVHRSDCERDGKWMLVRRSLGLTSFGMNLVDLAPGDSLREHSEIERDQEEVFIVLEGEAILVIDGEEHAAPAGTFVRLDPEPRRNVLNRSQSPATILLVSAPRSSGYQPMSWA